MTERALFDRRSLADQAFEMIEAAIVGGELLPGARLREAILSQEYGISRGPLREALGRLEGRQLVRRIPGVGVRVMEFSGEDILEVFAVREAIEGMACRLVARTLPERGFDRMARVLNNHQGRERKGQVPGYFQRPGESDFHYALVHACGNRWLIGIFDQIYYPLRVFRYRSSLRDGRADQALREHREILEAMRARDEDRAERLMRRHIATARACCEAALAAGELPRAAPEDGTERLIARTRLAAARRDERGYRT